LDGINFKAGKQIQLKGHKHKSNKLEIQLNIKSAIKKLELTPYLDIPSELVYSFTIEPITQDEWLVLIFMISYQDK
jgi:hypothetical protein